jgi:hypothetical protein
MSSLKQKQPTEQSTERKRHRHLHVYEIRNIKIYTSPPPNFCNVCEERNPVFKQIEHVLAYNSSSVRRYLSYHQDDDRRFHSLTNGFNDFYADKSEGNWRGQVNRVNIGGDVIKNNVTVLRSLNEIHQNTLNSDPNNILGQTKLWLVSIKHVCSNYLTYHDGERSDKVCSTWSASRVLVYGENENSARASVRRLYNPWFPEHVSDDEIHVDELIFNTNTIPSNRSIITSPSSFLTKFVPPITTKILDLDDNTKTKEEIEMKKTTTAISTAMCTHETSQVSGNKDEVKINTNLKTLEFAILTDEWFQRDSLKKQIISIQNSITWHKKKILNVSNQISNLLAQINKLTIEKNQSVDLLTTHKTELSDYTNQLNMCHD